MTDPTSQEKLPTELKQLQEYIDGLDEFSDEKEKALFGSQGEARKTLDESED